MQLPFSREAFLDVFAVYNTWLWPVAAILWLATAAAVVAHARGRARATPMFGLLAVQWAWAGLAYHAALFTRINPAAWLFAAVFLIEAGLLLRHGVMQGPRPLTREYVVRERVAYILIAYGLIYPAAALAGGDVYPYAPTFGVPDDNRDGGVSHARCSTNTLTGVHSCVVGSRGRISSIPPRDARRLWVDSRGLRPRSILVAASHDAGHSAVRRQGNLSRIG
jgi:hypothetical protein